MARTRRNRELTTEQKIEDILENITATEKRIAETEEKLTSLKNQKQELENNLRQEKINLLLETMEGKNISLDKAKEIIDNIA